MNFLRYFLFLLAWAWCGCVAGDAGLGVLECLLFLAALNWIYNVRYAGWHAKK